MASSEYNSFVIFVYDDIQWAFRALAGINAGDGVNHITLPGSLTSSILDIEETSNIGNPGVWIFSVGEGNCIYTHNILMVMGSDLLGQAVV